ncbi:HAMP domain-containing methyl-accepting chemotaxis protein [Desulfovibrio desulfuricans]|uniref:HAMP domain-containing methyl-accepting chemotaxis protein n=1 Tax=Desulfovibrio desulfuricans TaxID=876 RepID=UPI001DCF8E6D|nr:methyl-accepting chemotaxis protein [Desulfovibrio desulfuricans]MBT9749684.1 methyl-accepting chemotaxis protein [Desulfovibrio desulfuricans]
MRLIVKLGLSFFFITLVLLAMSGMSIKNISAMNKRFIEIDTSLLPSLIELQEMHLKFWIIRSDVLALISQTSPTEIERYSSNITSTMDSIRENHDRYFAIVGESEDQHHVAAKELIEKIDAISRKLNTVRKEILAFVQCEERGEAISIFEKKYTPLFNSLEPLYEELMALTKSDSKQVSAEAVATGENAVKGAYALSAAAVFFSIIVSLVLSRSIKHQLGKDPGELQAVASRVAAGDYDIHDANSDSVGVYASIVSMVQALKTHIERAQRESLAAQEQSAKATEALRQTEAANIEAQNKSEALRMAAARLQEVARVVSAATARLAAQIEQSDKGARETSGRLGEAASAMQQMNATVQEVARNASVASQASTETRAKAENGSEIVKRSLRSIDQVHQASMTLKGDMAQLHEHTQNINRIMGVISDIADQTNLLALNAAIEAARAGDAGRGFAVVADEVRKLAEKTMASTHDVANAIKAIQSSATQSMDSVDKAARQIEEANTYASQSGAALSDIVATVEGTADQVNAIAAASEQQSAASDEVSRAITQISEMSRQTSAAMREAADAVAELAGQTQNLMELMSSMQQ